MLPVQEKYTSDAYGGDDPERFSFRRSQRMVRGEVVGGTQQKCLICEKKDFQLKCAQKYKLNNKFKYKVTYARGSLCLLFILLLLTLNIIWFI